MCPMVRRPPDMEFALLGFLLQGPQHGYQIHQMVSDPSGLGLIWHLKQSHLYAMLNQLELDGYVTSMFQNQDPHPPRRVFELTESGKRVFYDWITSPVTVPRLIRQHFCAKLYFAQNENATAAKKLIEIQKSICQTWVNEFKEKLIATEKKSFTWSMYKYRLGQVQAVQDWLNSF